MGNKLNIYKQGYLPNNIRNLPYNIGHFFKTVKWAHQRATRGYSDYDTWDLDVYYARLIAESLKTFRENLHGCPYDFYDEEKDSDEKWTSYLKEMEQHFRGFLNENNEHPNKYEDLLSSRDNLSDEEYRNLLEEEVKIFEECKRELKEGLAMLEERFCDLWD